MRQKKRKTTEKETRHQRSHEVQQILTDKHAGKTKQMTSWSVSTFKGRLKVFRFKIVKYKTRAFNRKFEIKPIPILLNISLNANNHF